MENLKKIYKDKISKNLRNFFFYKNIHECPKLLKIKVNIGLGLLAQNKQILEKSVEEIRLITGQHPIISKSRASIAGFKIRKNMPLGLTVTLRNEKMYAFLERLFVLTLPRIRDFQGLSEKSVSGDGAYNIGIEDLSVFPELENIDNYQKKGCNISICTTAKTSKETLFLLKELGLPLKTNKY